MRSEGALRDEVSYDAHDEIPRENLSKSYNTQITILLYFHPISIAIHFSASISSYTPNRESAQGDT